MGYILPYSNGSAYLEYGNIYVYFRVPTIEGFNMNNIVRSFLTVLLLFPVFFVTDFLNTMTITYLAFPLAAMNLWAYGVACYYLWRKYI